MVHRRKRCINDPQFGVPYLEAVVDIVEGYRKVHFVESLDLLEHRLPSREAGSCDRGDAALQMRAPQIAPISNCFADSLVGRKSAADAGNNSCMLDQSVFIKQPRTDCPDFWP